MRAIKAGAEDFLTKPVAKEQLLETIRRALDHAEEVRARSEQVDALFARVASLTPRERQVFALVVRGLLNKQIAHELGTSERTVKAHRHMVMQKCGVRSVAELVMIAERTGILTGRRRAREGGARQRTSRQSLSEAFRRAAFLYECDRSPQTRHGRLDPAHPAQDGHDRASLCGMAGSSPAMTRSALVHASATLKPDARLRALLSNIARAFTIPIEITPGIIDGVHYSFRLINRYFRGAGR